MPSKYKIHPAANIFPMLSDEDFAGLKKDIEQNGQLDDIAFFDDMVIDGRNRLRACEELGIEPQWYELTECKDPVAYVLSKNLHRRHLTQSQRAQCAAEVARLRLGDNQHKRNEGSQVCLPIDDAAKAFGVSASSVKTAKHVADKGDNATVDAVKAGEITVSAAAKLVDVVPDKKEQRRIVKAGKDAVAAKIKEAKPDKSRRTKKDTSGGVEPVSSGPLAGLEPDSAGVDSEDTPPDRIIWLRERLGELYTRYLHTFGEDAAWSCWLAAVESFEVNH